MSRSSDSERIGNTPSDNPQAPSLSPEPASATLCGWCRESLVDGRRAKYCGRKCRQAAFRLRRLSLSDRVSLGPGAPPGLRFAYADPPYPGLAARYYRHEPTFAGEVDHRELILSLTAANYAGWALSTSPKALRDILPLCPAEARVCAWVKPGGVPPATFGLHNRWEVLIVVGGRKRRPGVRDWLRAQPARGWGTLTGRKPLAFCAWLFDCLGMVPGDGLVDVFPGTGAVTRAWLELSPRSRVSPGSGESSPPEERRVPAPNRTDPFDERREPVAESSERQVVVVAAGSAT